MATTLKRGRSNSISGRLRAASDLEESGIVTKFEKGLLKDCIISGDTELEAAIEKYETKGDASSLRAFLDRGNALPSKELLDGIELGFLNIYSNKGNRRMRQESFDSDLTLGFLDDNEDFDEMGSFSSQIAPRTYAPNSSRTSHSSSSNTPSVSKQNTPRTEENSNLDNNNKVPSASQAPVKIEPPPPPPPDVSNRKNSFDFDAMNRRGSFDFDAANRRNSFDFIDQELINFRRAYRTSSGSIGSFSGFNGIFDSELFNSDIPLSGRRESFSFVDIAPPSEDYDDLARTNLPFQRGVSVGIGRVLGCDDNGNDNTISNGISGANYQFDNQVKGEGDLSILRAQTSGLGNSLEAMLSTNMGEEGMTNSHCHVGDSEIHSYSSTSNSRPPLPIFIKSEQYDEQGDPSQGPFAGPQLGGPVQGQGYIGAYSPEARRQLIERFNEKRKHRVWTKKVKYDVRKNFADSRLRIKGRFVKKEDEEIMRVLLT